MGQRPLLASTKEVASSWWTFNKELVEDPGIPREGVRGGFPCGPRSSSAVSVPCWRLWLALGFWDQPIGKSRFI